MIAARLRSSGVPAHEESRMSPKATRPEPPYAQVVRHIRDQIVSA
jgi:hypothetical protein